MRQLWDKLLAKYDRNHNGVIDRDEREDPRQMFKAEVEYCWQNPGSVTNRPSFNRAPSVDGVVTDGTPNGKPW